MSRKKFLLSVVIFLSAVVIGVIIFSLYNISLVKDRSESNSDLSTEESIGNIEQPDEGSYDFPGMPEELNPELDVFKSLSEEQRLNNIQEYEIMLKKMPNNRYVPLTNSSSSNEKEIKYRDQQLKDFIMLESKVFNKKAENDEVKNYYILKIQDYKEKKEFLKYTIERNIELKNQKSGKHLSDSEIKSIEESIIKMDNDISLFTKTLESL